MEWGFWLHEKWAILYKKMGILHEKVAKLYEKRAQMQRFPSNTLEVKKGKTEGEVRKVCKLLKSGV